MTKKEVQKRAAETFKRVLENPADPNARIIAARRGNSADLFKPDDLIARADNAPARVRQAQEALEKFEPALDRFNS
jgi:hypothetical protein